jgi:2-phospho-L-lactate guanylyltransferase
MDLLQPIPAPMGPTIGLVPLRTGGKSRLDGSISAERRDALVLAMLDDVLAALRGAGVEDLRILAGSEAAVAAASARELPALRDPADHALPHSASDDGDTLLRGAVDAALATVPRSATRLIVAADLPRLGAGEVAEVLTHPADVVLAPTASGGTAMLRLAGGVLLPARYGAGSAGAHLREAEQAGLSVAVLDLPGCRHDVDAAADLAALARMLDGNPPGPATSAFVTGVRG